MIALYISSYASASSLANWRQASDRSFGTCICSNSGREFSLPKTSPKKAFKLSEREAGDVSSISDNGGNSGCSTLLNELRNRGILSNNPHLLKMASTSFFTRPFKWLSIISPSFFTYSDATSCPNSGCWIAHKQLMRKILEGVSLVCIRQDSDCHVLETKIIRYISEKQLQAVNILSLIKEKDELKTLLKQIKKLQRKKRILESFIRFIKFDCGWSLNIEEAELSLISSKKTIFIALELSLSRTEGVFKSTYYTSSFVTQREWKLAKTMTIHTSTEMINIRVQALPQFLQFSHVAN